MKNRITIGISSIVLIFLILCLAVFGLLSLSDAKSALSFAERHADSVQIYYNSDAVGQTFIRDYRNIYAETNDVSGTILSVSGMLPPGGAVSLSEAETVVCEIPMESGQTLKIELGADGNQVLSYYVYNSSEYVIDSHIPVWTGN